MVHLKGGTDLTPGCLMGVITEISFQGSSFNAEELHFIAGGSSIRMVCIKVVFQYN